MLKTIDERLKPALLYVQSYTNGAIPRLRYTLNVHLPQQVFSFFPFTFYPNGRLLFFHFRLTAGTNFKEFSFMACDPNVDISPSIEGVKEDGVVMYGIKNTEINQIS